MFKKQQNQKIIKQNYRNKINNRFYSSNFKFFLKIFLKKIFIYKKEIELNNRIKQKQELELLLNKLYSLLDKLGKKKLLKCNTINKKKSKLNKLLINTL